MVIAESYIPRDTEVVTSDARIGGASAAYSPQGVTLPTSSRHNVWIFGPTGAWLVGDGYLIDVSTTAAGRFIDTSDLGRLLSQLTLWHITPSPAPARTELGARLAAIRARIIASGTPLLSWDELDAELANMRDAESQEA
jgi:hypothetical protein